MLAPNYDIICYLVNQYYKWWVACDLCITQNYCVSNNHMHQSTWPIRFLRGRSTCRCFTCLVLHELWTKFWNITLLKIILFSPTLSLAPACTHKHEIIPFHNTMPTNLLITYILLPCLCLISFHYFSYLFSIRNLWPPCLRIIAHDVYDLRFVHSFYTWKDKKIIFPTQQVSWLTKIWVVRDHRNKIVFQHSQKCNISFS
jgi:hypothetical protein